MIINSCRYYFVNSDGMLNNDITGIITIQEDGDINESLIREINSRTIKVILSNYKQLTFEGYEGIINYYGDNINKSIRYEYNAYYSDGILRVEDTYVNTFNNDIGDGVIELFNAIKKINTIGKTFILMNNIYVCDIFGIANYIIECYSAPGKFLAEIDMVVNTDNFIEIYNKIKNIIDKRGIL